MSTMIYKAPGPHLLHDVYVDYVVVDGDINPHLENGWSLSPTEAAKRAVSGSVVDSNQVSADQDTQPEAPVETSIEAPVENLLYDSDGQPWNAKIHVASRALTSTGKWRVKPGVSKELISKVRLGIL